LVGCAYDADLGTSESDLILTDRCEVRGDALLSMGDFAEGDVAGRATGVGGDWIHAALEGGVLAGEPDFIFCRINGSTIGDVSGPAYWNGHNHHTFQVHVQDRGVPMPPTPVVGTTETRTIRATRRTAPTSFEDGVLDVGAGGAMRVTLPSTLPVVAGNAGTGLAYINFTRDARNARGETVICRYRGSSRGTRYTFDRCTGSMAACALRAGDQVDVRELTVRVESAASTGCRSRPTTTTVQVDLTVAPLTFIVPLRDFYSIYVHNAEGEVVHTAEGNLIGGDLAVTLTDVEPAAPTP
jgi:hypothetical protein